MKITARYSDGETAAISIVEVDITQIGIKFQSGETWLYDDMILIHGEKTTGQLSYRNKKVKGETLSLIFVNGMEDPARDYLKRLSKKLTGDSNWHFVRWQIITGCAIIGLMFLFYFTYSYANRAIVALIPDSWAVKAGDLVLDELYREFSSNVCHSPEGDKAMEKLVNRLKVNNLPYDNIRVQLVNNPMKNALTAPGGRIVILDGLVQKAESPEELAGVLAHEIGHVYYQHPMQGLVNVLGMSVVGTMIGGDAATIAVVMFSMSYNRDMERQADQKGLAVLADNDISAQGLLDFFGRLKKKEKDRIGRGLEEVLSTHPLTEERMDYISGHITQNKNRKFSTPVLSDDEWQAIKTMCKDNSSKEDQEPVSGAEKN